MSMVCMTFNNFNHKFQHNPSLLLPELVIFCHLLLQGQDLATFEEYQSNSFKLCDLFISSSSTKNKVVCKDKQHTFFQNYGPLGPKKKEKTPPKSTLPIDLKAVLNACLLAICRRVHRQKRP